MPLHCRLPPGEGCLWQEMTMSNRMRSRGYNGRVLVGVMSGVALSGCANLFTSTKDIDLEKNSYALDVKQRVVVSKKLDLYGDGKVLQVVCTEPSPDALTTISATAGADVASQIARASSTQTDGNSDEQNARAQNSRSVTAALAEQGAFVGLRTQSIQLLRDTMYRLCEGYASGAVSPAEFAAMQRRYQSTMLGLLAIEQLTRPVVAAQVVLASTASSAAGARPDDAQVDKLRTRLDGLVAADADAKVKFEKAKSDHETAEQALAANIKQAEEARQKAEKDEDARQKAAKEAADTSKIKAAGATAAKSFDDARQGLETTRKQTEADLRETRIRAAESRTLRSDAEAELAQARTRAASTAAGSGQFSAIGTSAATITASLGDSVRRIVSDINQNYLLSDCLSILTVARDEKLVASKASRPGQDALEATCTTLLTQATMQLLSQQPTK